MNIRLLLSTLGRFLVPFGCLMLIPGFVSLCLRENAAIPLGLCAVVTAAAGLVLFLVAGDVEKKMGVKESYLVVAGAWLTACLLGAVPYLVTGTMDGVVNAVFESTAGFTTTGMSVLTDLESLPRGILLWRSMSNWLGGMGVIMLFILLLPNMGIGAVNLYNAEVADFMPDKVVPKIKDKITLLWRIYLGFTVVVIAALMAAGMPAFDAVNHALTTVCTGGFSVSSQGLASYDSLSIEIVLMAAMLLGGVNFTLFIALLQGNGSVFLKNIELRVYLGLLVIVTVLIGASLIISSGVEWGSALRQASFQTISFATSTALTNGDYDQWPHFARLLLLLLMAIGGCSSSTSGGMKVSRALVLGKMAVAYVKKSLQPKQVQPIEIGGNTLGESVQTGISHFFFLFIGIFVAATLLLCALGYAPFTAMGASMAALGNTGSAFESLGSAAEVQASSAAVKITLGMCMLFGRLEIIPLLILFSPVFWKRRKVW